MRNGCQWWVALLLLAGCGGAPGGRSAGSPSADSAAMAGAMPVAGSARAMEAAADSSGAAAPAKAPRAQMPDRLSASGARRFLAAHPEALLLDVRNPDEWDDDLGHIERARLIPLPALAERMGEIEAWKDQPIVVVCRAGGRSREATGMLRAAGFRQAMNLEGGMLAWRASEKVAGTGR